MSKQSVYYLLPELSQSHDSKEIKRGLDGLRGVISVSVNPMAQKVAVDYDSTGTNIEDITDRIRKLGFSPKMLDHQEHLM